MELKNIIETIITYSNQCIRAESKSRYGRTLFREGFKLVYEETEQTNPNGQVVFVAEIHAKPYAQSPFMIVRQLHYTTPGEDTEIPEATKDLLRYKILELLCLRSIEAITIETAERAGIF